MAVFQKLFVLPEYLAKFRPWNVRSRHGSIVNIFLHRKAYYAKKSNSQSGKQDFKAKSPLINTCSDETLETKPKCSEKKISSEKKSTVCNKSSNSTKEKCVDEKELSKTEKREIKTEKITCFSAKAALSSNKNKFQAVSACQNSFQAVDPKSTLKAVCPSDSESKPKVDYKTICGCKIKSEDEDCDINFKNASKADSKCLASKKTLESKCQKVEESVERTKSTIHKMNKCDKSEGIESKPKLKDETIAKKKELTTISGLLVECEKTANKEELPKKSKSSQSIQSSCGIKSKLKSVLKSAAVICDKKSAPSKQASKSPCVKAKANESTDPSLKKSAVKPSDVKGVEAKTSKSSICKKQKAEDLPKSTPCGTSSKKNLTEKSLKSSKSAGALKCVKSAPDVSKVPQNLETKKPIVKANCKKSTKTTQVKASKSCTSIDTKPANDSKKKKLIPPKAIPCKTQKNTASKKPGVECKWQKNAKSKSSNLTNASKCASASSEKPKDSHPKVVSKSKCEKTPTTTSAKPSNSATHIENKSARDLKNAAFRSASCEKYKKVDLKSSVEGCQNAKNMEAKPSKSSACIGKKSADKKAISSPCEQRKDNSQQCTTVEKSQLSGNTAQTKSSKCAIHKEEKPAAVTTCEKQKSTAQAKESKKPTMTDAKSSSCGNSKNADSRPVCVKTTPAPATAGKVKASDASSVKSKCEKTKSAVMTSKSTTSLPPKATPICETAKTSKTEKCPSSQSLSKDKQMCVLKSNVSMSSKSQQNGKEKCSTMESQKLNEKTSQEGEVNVKCEFKASEPKPSPKTKITTCEKAEKAKAKSGSDTKVAKCDKSKNAKIHKNKTNKGKAVKKPNSALNCGRYIRAEKFKPIKKSKPVQQKSVKSSPQPQVDEAPSKPVQQKSAKSCSQPQVDQAPSKTSTGCAKPDKHETQQPVMENVEPPKPKTQQPVTDCQRNQTEKKQGAGRSGPVCRKGGPTSGGSDGRKSYSSKAKTYRNVSLATILVVMGFCGYTFMNIEHKERPEFVPYDYLYRRNKRFPWGDGTKSFFHNSEVNALPSGYEEYEGNEENVD